MNIIYSPYNEKNHLNRFYYNNCDISTDSVNMSLKKIVCFFFFQWYTKVLFILVCT